MSANSTPMAVFGPGSLYVTRNDIAGQTPVNIGYAQEFTYDEASETKELFGQNQYALVVARGTIKTTGKMKAAVVSGLALNAVFNGQSFVTGQLQMAQGEAHSIPGLMPYTVTITPPNTGTFNQDLGVIYALTGLPLQKVASSPTTGQYSVSGAVYTFAAADTGLGVLITYAYTPTGAGQTITITNTPIGTTPTFQLDYSSSLYGKPYYIRMFNCVAGKLTRAHKLVDYMMPEIDFNFFANSAGNVYECSYPEVS